MAMRTCYNILYEKTGKFIRNENSQEFNSLFNIQSTITTSFVQPYLQNKNSGGKFQEEFSSSVPLSYLLLPCTVCGILAPARIEHVSLQRKPSTVLPGKSVFSSIKRTMISPKAKGPPLETISIFVNVHQAEGFAHWQQSREENSY